MVLVLGASCPGETRGLHQNFVWCTADVGGAGNAVPRPPTSVLFPLAYAQQLIHLWALRCSTPSMTWQVVLPLVERRSGAPRRQGAAAGETAASRGQGRRTLLRSSPGLCLAPLKAGSPSVLSASACSPKFTILTLLYKS